MFKNHFKLIFYNLFIILFSFNLANSEIIKEIRVVGNDRISDQTIISFSNVLINESIDQENMNRMLKDLYDTNFFKNISISIDNNVLTIKVDENPIINKIIFDGIKSNKIKKIISDSVTLKSRSSYNELILNNDKQKIKKILKELGYYFPSIDIFVDDLKDNKLNITYKIKLGEKAKIKKISFVGDKKFKDKKLHSIIVSEESKFWKFVTNKKFVNEKIISLDKRLLKNFYLNKGYYDVNIDSTFAKLINKKDFELIYNIQAKEKFFFNNLSIDIPIDFEISNFFQIQELFKKLKGEPYSINQVEKILEEIDKITLEQQFQSISAKVEENIIGQKIDLKFIIEKLDPIYVERINIFGNNVTKEEVIRNQLQLDEGDPYNEILLNKSINNLKSLNFFRNVTSEVVEDKLLDKKQINIKVEEKPTGEISAGAGIGTSGSSFSFGVKENNYLGSGVALSSNISISDESLKGILTVTNPNYKNSDKSVDFSVEAIEIDRLKAFGYKTNKTGFSLGSNFEYLNKFRLGVANSNFYEKIDTDSNASAKQKEQEGNYWDSFLNLSFDYDTRNQKFQATEGFRSQYFIDMPVISETATLQNTYIYKYFTELYENNISTASIFLRSSNSLKGDDIKLSERIILPSNKLRGFERGKIGPKDGEDFIGGNYAASINFASTVPQLLESSENLDFLLFLDIGNVWGVDYFEGDDEGSEIRSSTGIGIDWLTPVGPLNFTFATTLSKADTDKTETFRFNLGTSF
ncbi:outer membrane protein assembly factor BamA [Candidatus Pelagibacter sp. HIMB1485]|uniref:outer membrane protein assembly factor BamA n=1 Tax=Candidatus Pelagibacter sp. HIMB1485 TaxID=3415415 RepID=UPI003F833713